MEKEICQNTLIYEKITTSFKKTATANENL